MTSPPPSRTSKNNLARTVVSFTVCIVFAAWNVVHDPNIRQYLQLFETNNHVRSRRTTTLTTTTYSEEKNDTYKKHLSRDRHYHGVTRNHTATTIDSRSSTSTGRFLDTDVSMTELRQEIVEYLAMPRAGDGDVADNAPRRPKPPHTPGAFIHVGKTGGSTLSMQLENGCHSFIVSHKSPCKSVPNPSYLSQTTTYVHVPDFPRLHEAQNKPTSAYGQFRYYLFTVRDPLSRFLSVFTHQHPLNKHKGSGNPTNVHLFDPCFPTVELFTSYLGDEPLTDYTYSKELTSKFIDSSNCTNLARAMLDHRIERSMHFYYDTSLLVNWTSPHIDHVPILVIRTEYLWDDYLSANHALGQPLPSETFPEVKIDYKPTGTNSSEPVTKDVSELGRKRLCIALRKEYDAYLKLLSRAENLTPSEKRQSLDTAREHCPELDLSIVDETDAT